MIFNNWNPTTQDPSFSQNMQKKRLQSRPYLLLSEPVVAIMSLFKMHCIAKVVEFC